MDFLKEKLDNFLHKNPDVVQHMENKIKQSEKERKELSGIRKLARERAKKVSLHNKKLEIVKSILIILKATEEMIRPYLLQRVIQQVVL